MVRFNVRAASGRGATLVGAGLAVLADRVVGEPPACVHPVAAFGRLMTAVERHAYRDDRAAGVAYAVGGTLAAAAVGGGLRRLGGRAGATFVAAEAAVAGRMLADAALDVGASLTAHDLETARARLPALVGRDAAELDEAGVARAAVESVAENTVDAVVAPALWAAALGAPGVLAYRAINTLDAMVGHRSARYERFGWAAARLDDAANWIPARATALAVMALRPRRAAAVWHAVRCDAPVHPSPNAGVAEAAFAGALGVRLGGRNRYGDRVEDRGQLGTGRTVVCEDIDQAIRLSRHVSLAVAGALIAASVIAGLLPSWR